MIDKDWASRHLARPVEYRDRKPETTTKPWGKVLGVIFAVGIVGGAAVAWKMGLLDDYLRREAPTVEGSNDALPVDAAPPVLSQSDPAVPRPPTAVQQLAVMTPDEPVGSPPPMDAKQRESILRGIDVQTRRMQEHEARAAGLEAQIKHATAKLYPPNGSPKVDFETYMLRQIESARAAKETSTATNLELQLGDYRGKLKELRIKLAHERDVMASCNQMIERERAKLTP